MVLDRLSIDHEQIDRLHAVPTYQSDYPTNPRGLRTRTPTEPCLVIDRVDAVVNDLDRNIRAMWGDRVLNFR